MYKAGNIRTTGIYNFICIYIYITTHIYASLCREYVHMSIIAQLLMPAPMQDDLRGPSSCWRKSWARAWTWPKKLKLKETDSFAYIPCAMWAICLPWKLIQFLSLFWHMIIGIDQVRATRFRRCLFVSECLRIFSCLPSACRFKTNP